MTRNVVFSQWIGSVHDSDLGCFGLTVCDKQYPHEIILQQFSSDVVYQCSIACPIFFSRIKLSRRANHDNLMFIPNDNYIHSIPLLKFFLLSYFSARNQVTRNSDFPSKQLNSRLRFWLSLFLPISEVRPISFLYLAGFRLRTAGFISRNAGVGGLL